MLIKPIRFVICSAVCLVVTCLEVAAPAQASSASWMDPQWRYRVSLTAVADSIEGTGDLTGFPFLVVLDGASHGDVFTKARSDGADVRFTAGDGVTPLATEVVSYDAAARRAQIWVKAPELSRNQNQFFLYYGNPAASSSSTTDVWADYAAVYHFEEDPSSGTLRDSSPDQAHATPVASADGAWTADDLVDGQIGRGWHYDGQEITRSNAVYVSELSWTTSAWLFLDSRTTDFFLQANPCYFHLSAQASDVSHDGQYQNGYCGNQDWRWLRGDVEINSWHHWTWVFSEADSTVTLYYDGVESPVSWKNPSFAQKWHPHGVGNQSEPVGILGPMYFNPYDPMHGVGDEFRLQPGVATPERIRTEYRNQNDPLGFFVFGPEEDREATAVDPAKHSRVFLAQNVPNPFRELTSIRFRLQAPAAVRLAVYDLAGREIVRLVDGFLPAGLHDRSWNGRTRQGRRAASGMYVLRLTTPQGEASVKALLAP